MKVLKFGGTSVGSTENMRAVMELITDGEQKVVVLSAMSGTTNSLVEISNYLYKKNKDSARMVINQLEEKYIKVVANLFEKAESKIEGIKVVKESFTAIRSFTSGDFKEIGEKTILAQGELISTALFVILMKENGHKAVYLPALDFMRIDADKAADLYYTKEAIPGVIEKAGEADYYITQGFICRNANDEIDNLQRGGSDYTATLIGAAIESEEVQIWTDIDGFHNNDPRFVEKTRKIEQLSFDEAAELAYFGAKILHPLTVLPAKLQNIPVRLKNTMNPSDSGTLIASNSSESGIKAVAAKDGITAIKIRSYRMLMAYGFMKSIFEIFEFFKTPIDMVSTSEVAVSLTIDDTRNLEDIKRELQEYGEVEIDTDQSIVCIVGDLIAEEKGFAAKIFNALEGIPIRMISYGGSRHNISILVPTSLKKQTLQALNDNLLNV
ncbi:MAG: aspartate kinase [Bacteroidetes bacterium GWF2_42_66]|nr:MAG: aspartate kinase [Bacteroidetes bacterium GWA2_42_15]OFY01486.1 MAG: aspartate kinase [Bacteroidetes bacterium GWE2_42_39]OFY43333.1 MAG: aspartate kinase [Bacteroidetes bacterium GWF2_42_66]HBL77484.1 aspartate kinase [Prolixibacteraceae bacterium]HCR91291.1 aspartate kinase [Prolixibacteraceae bacterium]